MSDITGLEIVEPKDTTADKVGNARKAIAAGVSAAFAAAIPLVGAALTDGVVTGQEAGGVAAAFAGALVSVAYVTWQTVNKIKPSDIPKLEALVGGVPQIVLKAADPSEVKYVGLPDVPADPADLGSLEADDYEPKHSA